MLHQVPVARVEPSKDSDFSWEVHCITACIAEARMQGAVPELRLLNPVARMCDTGIKLRGNMLFEDVLVPIDSVFGHAQ